jgi:aspartate/glutamate/aspartate-prephenate aminotransferase
MQVSLVPGDAFGNDDCIRISYVASLDTLRTTINNIEKSMLLLRPAAAASKAS